MRACNDESCGEFSEESNEVFVGDRKIINIETDLLGAPVENSGGN